MPEESEKKRWFKLPQLPKWEFPEMKAPKISRKQLIGAGCLLAIVCVIGLYVKVTHSNQEMRWRNAIVQTEPSALAKVQNSVFRAVGADEAAIDAVRASQVNRYETYRLARDRRDLKYFKTVEKAVDRNRFWSTVGYVKDRWR